MIKALVSHLSVYYFLFSPRRAHFALLLSRVLYSLRNFKLFFFVYKFIFALTNEYVEHPFLITSLFLIIIFNYFLLDDNNKEIALAKVVKRGAKTEAQVRIGK